MSRKPRLTPEEDAALYAELKPELPKVRKVADRASSRIETLSDIGQMAAVAEITLAFILRHVNDEAEALALSQHLRSQIDIGIKKVFSGHPAPPTTQ